MSSAPVNIFQRLMRKWEAVHPYNAAQVMRIAGEPDRAALMSAWLGALSDSGLGRLHLDNGHYKFEALTGHGDAFGVVFTEASLNDHITHELNRPFNDSIEPPFRPFVIRGEGQFFAGVVYQHWVADSASIRMLLRE